MKRWDIWNDDEGILLYDDYFAPTAKEALAQFKEDTGDDELEPGIVAREHDETEERERAESDLEFNRRNYEHTRGWGNAKKTPRSRKRNPSTLTTAIIATGAAIGVYLVVRALVKPRQPAQPQQITPPVAPGHTTT